MYCKQSKASCNILTEPFWIVIPVMWILRCLGIYFSPILLELSPKAILDIFKSGLMIVIFIPKHVLRPLTQYLRQSLVGRLGGGRRWILLKKVYLPTNILRQFCYIYKLMIVKHMLNASVLFSGRGRTIYFSPDNPVQTPLPASEHTRQPSLYIYL